jgi:hypothetical protein
VPISLSHSLTDVRNSFPRRFCRGIDVAALAPVAPRMVRDLGPFLLETTEDTLSLVLETLASVVEVQDGGWLTVDLARDLVLALLEVWTKNIKGTSCFSAREVDRTADSMRQTQFSSQC